ncbi:MAG: SCO family protein [Alphaproteobacteria bacterium]|nr:SCO family protein [Alphaproteobacteria bacterium]MBP7758510.1 SCO family protein [Alphaproteobacteria bacterium]MBP7761943.1 SCO family protein [Alphaproteobacteria bacterium]MBP7905767.1 SCO family protein [Alphaproteobacteria bacterium]
MKRQDLFALSLAAAMNIASADSAQAQDGRGFRFWQEKPPVVNSLVLPGSERVGGSLSALTRNGQPVGNALNGKYLLVYFGTPYRLPNCSADLGVINEGLKMLEQRYGREVAARVTPVFIYPPHDPARQPPASNLSGYINAPGSRYVGLTGTREQVMEVARHYRARYMDGDGAQGGTFGNHTRFTYLMAPDGKNLAIFPGDTPYIFIADQLALNLTRDGIIRPQAGNTPGAER